MSTSNGMKPSSWRPFYFFIILSMVVLLFPGLLIPFWINKVNKIEREVDLITSDVQQELVLGVEKTQRLLSPFNQSAIDLARLLSSLLGRNELHFSTIETRVAPVLFQALSTIPYLSQVSFIGMDGLFFSYYNKGNQRFAVYSNISFSTFPFATANYTWYTRPAQYDTGKLYGEAIQTTPLRVVDEDWFQKALNSSNGHASAGTGWENGQDSLILNTMRIGTTAAAAAISLGFLQKSLIDFFINASVYGGGFYFASNDGNVFAQGIPNTRMVLDGNIVSIQLLNPNGDQILGVVGNLTCSEANHGAYKASILEIRKTKYFFQCSPLEILGMQSVYVLALPYAFGGPGNLVHHNMKSAFLLLILLLVVMVVFVLAFIFLMYGAAKREMHLYDEIIKQKEATKQAERKGMNTSLAYASASHDVRASLAGVIGLIELCRKEVPPQSDLGTTLRQAETCTQDLLGILNSVLDSSKIESGRIELRKEGFDLEQLVEETVDLYHPIGMKKGVDVVLDTCDGSLSRFSQVIGDRGRIKQVFSNLLSNAVKFTTEGHVSLRVWVKKPTPKTPPVLASSSLNNWMRCIPCSISKNDRELQDLQAMDGQEDEAQMEFVFEVNDTGKGIPKEKKNIVFENYVQVNEAASEGTGLGLGIVQSLVRLMGGEIAIVDKKPGERGTCFRFNIFLPTCGTSPSTTPAPGEDHRMEFCYSSSDSLHQHLAEGSQVILFISSEERSNVVKRFMRRLGIHVSVVKQYQQLPLTLKKIKETKFNPRSHVSENSSSTQVQEVPHDGADDVPFKIKIKTAEAPSNFILMVIDTSAGPFQEVSRAIAEFRRDIPQNSSRIAWIDSPGADGLHCQSGLEVDKLPSTDVLVSKPLHGSRLHQVIGLLPEFGGALIHEVEPTTKEEEIIPSYARNVSLEYSISPSSKEIQEIDNRPLKGKKVLVAEDNPILRRIAVATVSGLGAETHQCKDGEEALRLVLEDINYQREHRAHLSPPFDYILMDCEMPVMSGFEATRSIREAEKEWGLHTPILALTSHTGDQMNNIIEAGMDYCLFKPLSGETLLEAIIYLASNIVVNVVDVVDS